MLKKIRRRIGAFIARHVIPNYVKEMRAAICMAFNNEIAHYKWVISDLKNQIKELEEESK